MAWFSDIYSTICINATLIRKSFSYAREENIESNRVIDQILDVSNLV